MADDDAKICRICLTSNRDDNISDSSCYAKFFIEVMSVKVFNPKLLLCMWCKAALRQAMAVLTLALESEKILHKIPPDIPIKSKSLHTLTYIHNSHIDIPPYLIEYQDFKTEDMLEETEDITNPLLEIQNNDEIRLNDQIRLNDEIRHSDQIRLNDEIRHGDQIRLNDEIRHIDQIRQNIEMQDNNEILFKNVSVKSSDISNEESISNELVENEIAIKKINKKELHFNEMKFEVQYLNLEEQLKEMDLKKLKYKDFYFQCNECGVGFVTSDVFEQHKNRHTELSGPHRCTICALHFKSQECLSQHMLTHKRRFKCTLCSSEFTRWSHCVGHRYKCGGVSQLVACVECAKIFSNEYALKIHMKVHKTEKKYCCKQCDKKFGNKQRLTVHLRSHSGIKPYSCSECARSFATRSNLRAHSAVHDHSTQYYCVECHTYYKTAKSLKRHFNESAKHVGLKSDIYSCKECIKQFSTEISLNRHLASRHGTVHRCNHCDKTFSSNSNLNKHVKCIHTAK